MTKPTSSVSSQVNEFNPPVKINLHYKVHKTRPRQPHVPYSKKSRHSQSSTSLLHSVSQIFEREIMRASSRFAAGLALAGAVLTGVDAAIQTVTRSGRYLYTADGNRFYIKGVAYQEQGEDISVDIKSSWCLPTLKCHVDAHNGMQVRWSRARAIPSLNHPLSLIPCPMALPAPVIFPIYSSLVSIPFVPIALTHR